MPLLSGSEATIAYEQSGQGPDLVWVAGGGSRGRDWRLFQTPFFDDRYRSTTFDGRGIGDTRCDLPQPWPIEAFARDTAELIEAVCQPPVAIVGSSLGSAIVQQVAIDRPDLLRCAVVMGTGAWSTGWGWDYQEAEIEFRRAGGSLDGMMGVTHYAQAPPQDGQEMAEMIPGAEFHLLAEMGHASWYGHAHDTINPYILNLLDQYS